MFQEKWTDLEKGSCPNHYRLEIRSAYGNCHCPATINFSQCAFDNDDEALVAIDNNGIAYHIDLSDTPAFKKLGSVGISTFVTFNSMDKNELLVGLSSTNIKVFKINAINDFCALAGHTAPPTNISFYKNYYLTSSNKEVIVWQNKSYSKAHQLRLNTKNIVIKKAIFSSVGVVAVLYQTNIIQAWIFQQFDNDRRIDIQKYGINIVKDFNFTKDGRAMIVCGLQNRILVFNTSRWDLLKAIDLYENFNGGRQLSVVSLPLDGGANSIIAIVTSDCKLKFISLATSNFIENCCESDNSIKKIAVSNKGCYLVYISRNGFINIVLLDKLLNVKLNIDVKKVREQRKTHVHKAENDLKCVNHAIKEELKLERILPILREFGEYPEKHRTLIWTTLMELPNNRQAYIDLSNKVSHEGIFKWLSSGPLYNKSKNTLLGTILSCLLHWCPILEECTFLPKLVEPFLNIFQKNPVLQFEASLFILMNYCQKWFEYHPLPPLNILGMMENILLEADPSLFNYFCERGLTATDYAWPLLQTMLSEVLSTNDWMIMWDHLLSIRKPWFILMCAVAYNITYRKTITSNLRTIEDFQQFYKTPGHVSIKNILKIAHKLDCETPHRIHPYRYLKNDITTIPNQGPYPPFLHYEFPKYLTDEIRNINLKKQHEKERRLRGFQLHAMELLEKKRLRAESERFVKYVHEMRLNELRKCYENQMQENERLLQYARKETKDLDPDRYLRDDVKCNGHVSDRRSSSEFERKRRKSKHRNSKMLQEQVDRLEFEVQNLLVTLHNKSRTKSRIK